MFSPRGQANFVLKLSLEKLSRSCLPRHVHELFILASWKWV